MAGMSGLVRADSEVGRRGAPRMRRSASRSLLIAVIALAATAAPAAAADFVPAAGTYTVDTTALKLTGPGTDITGANEGGIATFRFGIVNIANTVTINAAGSRPFRIIAGGNLTHAGTINSNGGSATNFVAGPIAGGAGGGAGGAQHPNAGAGPGGGKTGVGTADGAGGGGFGGVGARGAGIAPLAAGGVAYGNLNASPTSLPGGSGGGGASSGGGSGTGGGGGGGAVALFGQFVTVTGTVRVDGGGGAVGGCGASAGGSGGGIVIHGDTVDVSGLLLARGGDGGRGGFCAHGGGGGGGRIAYQYRTLVASGTALVNGGVSGVRDTTGCCPGGVVGPDPTGAAGVVTKLQAADSATTPATSVTSSTATLNGTINARGNPTTYFFDFGPTTDYGIQVPGGGGNAGSDSSPRALSEAVGGLQPNTTYHYRLVAVDSLGFTTLGPDIGFTTPAAPAPAPPPSGGGGGGGTGPQADPTRILIAMPFAFSKSTNRWTRFTLLQIKAIPIASTLKVTCKAPKGKKCPGGNSYTKRNAFGTVSLKKWLKKKLPAGTKMTVTVTKAGNYIGAVKIMTIRKKNRPRFTDRCLLPGATRAVGC